MLLQVFLYKWLFTLTYVVRALSTLEYEVEVTVCRNCVLVFRASSLCLWKLFWLILEHKSPISKDFWGTTLKEVPLYWTIIRRGDWVLFQRICGLCCGSWTQKKERIEGYVGKTIALAVTVFESLSCNRLQKENKKHRTI